MGWKEFEIEREREREGVREQAQRPDPFNRGLSILFASKHPQNTRTLFCLSSSKPASLSLSSSPMPHLPLPRSLWSLAFPSTLPLFSTLCLHLCLSALVMGLSTPLHLLFFSIWALLNVIYRKVRQRDGGTGSGLDGFEPGSPWATGSRVSWANAYLFAPPPSLPSCSCLPPTHPLSLSKLHESHFIIYSSLSQRFFSDLSPSVLSNWWSERSPSPPLFHLSSLSFSSFPPSLLCVSSPLLSRVQRRKIGLAGSVSI